MSESDFSHHGGCFCGAVRFEAQATAGDASDCHCESCRRAAGALSVAWITVPLAQFRWTQGRPVEYRSSPKVTRTHCAACGTSLTYTTENWPDSIDITVASLDHPDNHAPLDETWCEDEVRFKNAPAKRARYATSRAAGIKARD